MLSEKKIEISPDKFERLVFIKYLIQTAEESKSFDSPLSSKSVLTLHDAVECFLQLIHEELTGKSKLTGHLILKNYVDEINEVLKIKNKPQIHYSFIKRLNELRNQLKHTTIFIDKRNIYNLFSETEVFLIDFSKWIFNIDFENLSLLELISNRYIKNYLIEARNYFKNKRFKFAIFSIGKAFYVLESEGTNIRGKFGEDILSKHHILDYLVKYDAQRNSDKPDKIQKENLKEIAEDLNRFQDELFDLKKVLFLSINLKEYLKFRCIMPYVTKIRTGTSEESEFWSPDEDNKIKVRYSSEQVKFCFDFVLKIALKHND